MDKITLDVLHQIVKGIKEDTGDIKTHIEIQNGRISKLENWRSFILGASAIINIIIVPVVIYLFFKG